VTVKTMGFKSPTKLHLLPDRLISTASVHITHRFIRHKDKHKTIKKTKRDKLITAAVTHHHVYN